MPISLVPKLKKTSGERREGAHPARTHPAHHLPVFKAHRIKSHLKAQWEREQVSSHHFADKDSEALGGWGTHPARGSTQVSGPQAQALRSSLALHNWSPVRQAPSELASCSRLTLYHPPSVLYFAQLVLPYFPTVSRKILSTNQMHVKQTATNPFSFDWITWNRTPVSLERVQGGSKILEHYRSTFSSHLKL